MPIQTEMLRIESKELMAILEDAAIRMNKKNRGYFSYDLRVERDVALGGLFSRTLITVYILRVIFKSGRFGIGSAEFSFESETLDEIYSVAMTTIKAWADEYFKQNKGLTHD